MTSPEQLDKAKECGLCQMTGADTAIILGIKAADLENGPLLDAYVLGKLEAELAVRHAVYDNATRGDVNAQKSFLKLAAESAIEVEPE